MLVLTLATPHQRPPGPPQRSLMRFYRSLAEAPPKTVPIVSIAGGWHDVQARSLKPKHGIKLTCP